ncbi:DUF397 domain-containing protein [Streptomyces sp. H-KF8]|uniref:DUF397 domain-containing protein n=1 Tax=Streptomyces sp. H-KF8 TaxID=1727216 RepID=UPI0007EDEB62|nr:DUF397 domain-containing protein [Streptomyces sp. H-KF8]OBQ49650.1 DUF397 domain-containing protein [Streptomyces sp. H-KF8]
MKASSPEPAVGELSWFKSSYSSGSGGDCVEVADAGAAVLVRDSKRPEAAILTVPATQWTAFVRMATRD